MNFTNDWKEKFMKLVEKFELKNHVLKNRKPVKIWHMRVYARPIFDYFLARKTETEKNFFDQVSRIIKNLEYLIKL